LILDKLDEQLKANLEGNFELGWKLVQELEQERPNCNRCAFNRGWMLLRNNQLKKGFDCLNRGRWENVFGSPPLETKKPIWGINHKISHKSKYILFRGEGGLGDEIINIRFVKDIKEKTNAKVIVSCDKSLMDVFSRVKGVDAIVERGKEQFVYHDSWIPAMSAISCLDYEYSDLSGKSYLSSISNIGFPDKKLKIGIRWSGNPQFEHEQFRRFDPHSLLNMSNEFPEFSFYSFQKDDNLIDLKNYQNVVDLNNLMIDWDTTLSYLNEMDLVITSCTSIAHASAALGKPTWVITPILSYYIWALDGKKSPWYNSVNLYRQNKFQDWSNVFIEIKNDLKKINLEK